MTTNDHKPIATVQQDPAELIRYAVEKGANLESLEKLLTIRERFEKGEAVKAYNEAMAQFKANPPKIRKDKKVNTGTYQYHHASLFNVVESISQGLSKWGLSASWRVAQAPQISVTCRITHRQGHYEETTISAPADTSGAKNAIQQIGSTITYLQRYTLLAMTGLATFDQDDDGAAVITTFISDKEHSELVDLCAEYNVSIPKLLDYLNVESLAKLPKSLLSKAKAAINAKRIAERAK